MYSNFVYVIYKIPKKPYKSRVFGINNNLRRLFTSARLGGFLKIFSRNLRKGVDKRYTKYTNLRFCFCAKGGIEAKCKIYLDFVVTMRYNKEGGKESHFIKRKKRGKQK